MTIAEKFYNIMLDAKGTDRDDGVYEPAYPLQEHCMKIAEECRENKSKLIGILSHHPNWDEENLRVHFNRTFDRPADAGKALDEFSRMYNALLEMNCNSNSTDPDFKVKAELYTLGLAFERYKIFFCDPNIISDLEEAIKQFYYDYEHDDGGYTTVSLADAHIHSGAKTTKAVMKLLRQYGFESLTQEQQHTILQSYSKYADAMNPMQITRHTVLSVNPVDFMLMSNGNSWSSCHTIYPHRGYSSYDGCYCGGCESYAYDTVTMILYTVDGSVPDDQITDAGKINRQLHFFNGDVLVSCRCYPQSSSEEEYNTGKAIVQQIIAYALGRPNVWRESDWRYDSEGYQYRDYVHFGPYKAYRLSDIEEDNRATWTPNDLEVEKKSVVNSETGEVTLKDHIISKMIIGSKNARCSCCGGRLDQAEFPFCRDCAEEGGRQYCDCCHEYVDYDEDDMYWVGDDHVCPACFDEYCFRCECCDEYYYTDDQKIYIEAEDREVCQRCAERYYHQCYDCGNWFSGDDGSFIEGEFYCDGCMDELISEGTVKQCDECGDWFFADNMTKLGDGTWVCGECYDSLDCFECPDCGEVFRGSEGVLCDDGDMYCVNCAENHLPPKPTVYLGRAHCDICGKEFGKDESIGYVDGKRICNDCVREHCATCCSCKEEIHFKENMVDVSLPCDAGPVYACKHCIDRTWVEAFKCQLSVEGERIYKSIGYHMKYECCRIKDLDTGIVCWMLKEDAVFIASADNNNRVRIIPEGKEE